MSLKYFSIWDKQKSVLTPSGEIFTPEEWMARYPVAQLESAIVVGGAMGLGNDLGLFDGSFFGELSIMVADAERMGCDFSDCTTPEEKLERIEYFQDHMPAPPAPEDPESTPEERMAASLEILAMNAMETVNPDDPDEE